MTGDASTIVYATLNRPELYHPPAIRARRSVNALAPNQRRQPDGLAHQPAPAVPQDRAIHARRLVVVNARW